MSFQDAALLGVAIVLFFVAYRLAAAARFTVSNAVEKSRGKSGAVKRNYAIAATGLTIAWTAVAIAVFALAVQVASGALA